MKVFILYGVSGTGKTTLGLILSQRLNLPFYDADDFHSRSNIAKMVSGRALNDYDREPWLLSMAESINKWTIKSGAVLACSALKEDYRRKLVSKSKESEISWIFLEGSKELISNRLEKRKGHYFKSNLLQSQFDDLEIANYGCRVNIEKSPEIIIGDIMTYINEQ